MSRWDDEEEESPSTRRSYSPAEAAADLAFYGKMKRAVVLGTLLAVALPAISLSFWFPWFGLALAVGAVAGIANALLSMYGNERLLERRKVGAFVLSSFVRIGLFGIVPVILAVRAPTFWTLALYFVGFFTPLAVSVGLNCKRK